MPLTARPCSPEALGPDWPSGLADAWVGFGARPAMVWVRRDGRPRVLTFAHLADRVRRFANLLANLGVAAGESVVVQLPNVPEWWEVAAGAMRAGVSVAPVPHDAGAAGLTDRAAATTAGIVVVDAAHVEDGLATRRACPSVRHVLCVGGLPRADAVNYHAVMHLEEPDDAPVVPRDPVLITGTGQEVSAHGRTDLLRVWAELGPARCASRPGDLHWNGTPRETVTGFSLGLVQPWSAGAAILVDETGCDTRALLERFPVTTVSAPGSWYAELAGPGSGNLRRSALRWALATGSRPDEDVVRAWFRETGLRIHAVAVRAEPSAAPSSR